MAKTNSKNIGPLIGSLIRYIIFIFISYISFLPWVLLDAAIPNNPWWSAGLFSITLTTYIYLFKFSSKKPELRMFFLIFIILEIFLAVEVFIMPYILPDAPKYSVEKVTTEKSIPLQEQNFQAWWAH
jgi:hypothetical protein